MHNKGSGRRFELGVQNHRRSGRQESPSGVQGWCPGRGSGGQSPQKLKNFKSSYKQILSIFGSNSHTIHEIETLIIENENYEAQLQSANNAPIRTTFIQCMKKWVKQLGTPYFHVSQSISNYFADVPPYPMRREY